MQANEQQPEVEQQSESEWVVRVRRGPAPQATGAVVTSTAPSADAPAPHANLAAARAWREVATARVGTGDHDGAIQAARQGIDELGDRYRPRRVKDDTALKIAAADERVEQGAAADGARILLRVLESRLAMYVQRHAGAVD